MASIFSPTPEDVKRYRHLRSRAVLMNARIVTAISDDLRYDVAEAIGLVEAGEIVYPSPNMPDVLTDCCMFDWYEDGSNFITRFIEVNPAEPGSDEARLFDAYLQAEYRIIAPRSAVPGAGLCCRDVLNGGEFFLMDIAFSRNALITDASVATRTFPMGDYWMTTGAALPLGSEKAAEAFCDTLRTDDFDAPGIRPLLIVRALIEDGAAERVRYEKDDFQPPELRPAKELRMPRWKPKRRGR